MRIKTTYLVVVVAFIAITGLAGIQNSFRPPQGFTGATGNNCRSCHGDFGLNAAGGSVTVSGLPTTGYLPGQGYNFSLTITHAQANRKRWGFSIAAKNSVGQNIGTFSSTNPNAAVNGSELSQQSAVVTPDQSSFTYNNLKWTAPASPGTNDHTVTFYYVGNAADNSSSDGGDYIYAGSTQVLLPVTLEAFKGTVKGKSVLLSWSTRSESNSSYFVIEKSADQLNYIVVDKVQASGFSEQIKNYSYTDDKTIFFDKPVYYRIAMVDKDGKRKYSGVINVVVNSNQTFVKNVYPNAIRAGNNLFINIVSNQEQQISIELFSFSGTRIKETRKALIAGENVIQLPVNRFTAEGLYSLVIRTNDGIQQIPVMIIQ